MSRQAVEKAVEIAGGQLSLAKKIGTGQATVWKWLNRARREVPPADYVLLIEQATGITRHELRPDLYPREEAAA